jgi:NTE family protein
MPVKNLVFQGGGVKGIAYVGVLDALERAGVLAGVTRVAGTSAGAITAALVACGATAADLSDALTHTSFRSFADGGGGFVVDVARVLEKGYGIHPGVAIETWLRQHIGALTERYTGAARPDLTLGALHALAVEKGAPFRQLFAISTNLCDQRAAVLSADTTPDLPVWRAVRMSMSIPLFFASVEQDGAWWADGAVSWNYPIDLFDGVRRQPVDHGELPASTTASPRGETIGFCMGTQAEVAALRSGWRLPPVQVHDFRSYMASLVNFLLNEATLLHLDDDDLARSVFIDTASVHTTQFDLTPEQAQTLVANGRSATEAFLARAAPTIASTAATSPSIPPV